MIMYRCTNGLVIKSASLFSLILAMLISGSSQASADGPAPITLQKLLAAGSVGQPSGLSASQLSLITGALQAAGGDASNTNVTATGSSIARSEAAISADEINAAALAAAALPITGGTMTGALTVPSATVGSGVMVLGPSVAFTGKQRSWDGNGASAANSDFFSNRYMYGAANAGVALYEGGGESITDPSQGGFSLITALDYLSSGATGNRQVIYGNWVQGQTPAQQGTSESMVGGSRVAVAGPRPAGWGWPVGLGTVSGGVETGWDYNQISAQGQNANYGREIDVTYDPGIGVGENMGLTVGSQNSTFDTVFGTNRPGAFANIAVDTFGLDWDCHFCINKPTGSWTADGNAMGFGVYVQAYGGTPTTGPLLRSLLEGRPIGYTVGSIEVPGFGVSPIGQASANGLVTTGAVTAQTATLSGGNIVRPGFYTGWPSLSVAAPTAGGTTATMTVTSMVARKIAMFGSTGRGYVVGDVLTGTGFTYTVASVDASGGILTGTIAGTSATSVPTNPIQSPSGGTGSGASLHVTWARDSTNTVFVPQAALFAATGSGYAVGDTITLVGDTGSPGVFTVTTVTSTGGIMMGASAANGIVATTAGSVTAISTSTYHPTTTSGSGSGASVQPLYGIAGVVVGVAGSGYQTQPPPLIVPSQTNWGNAEILAVMSAVPTALNLNGVTTEGMGASGPVTLSGGAISNGTAAIPLTCTIASPTNGVSATCHASMAVTVAVKTQGAQGTGYAASTTYPLVDGYGNTLGSVVTGSSVGSSGQITSVASYAVTSTAFPLVNASIPAGPFTIKGGNNNATVTYVAFAPVQAIVDDPGNGYAVAPAVTVGAAQNQTTAASGTATLAQQARIAGNLLVTGSIQAGISAFKAQSGPYSLTTADCGMTIRDSFGTAHVYTVPAGLPIGCKVDVIQAGSGAITFTGASGIVAEEYNTGTATYVTAGQFAKAMLQIDSSSSFLLTGQVQ